MKILDVVKERRSIRKFLPKEISETVLEGIKDSLIWAPSAGNLQSRKFYFVFNGEIKEKLASAAHGQNFVAKAPLVIVGCLDTMIRQYYGERGTGLYAIQDVAASIMGMMLVAHEAGLGSVWVSAFDEKEVIEILDMPRNLRPIALVPVGYPAYIPSPPPRVPKEEAIVIINPI